MDSPLPVPSSGGKRRHAATVLVVAFGRSRDIEAPLGPSAARGTTPITIAQEQLRVAVDGLLAAVNPQDPSVRHFPEFVRTKLAWLNREHQAGHLQVLFFPDTVAPSVPADIVMASGRTGATATIFVSQTRLASDLLNAGQLSPPFGSGGCDHVRARGAAGVAGGQHARRASAAVAERADASALP
jgi:hypothetical protein